MRIEVIGVAHTIEYVNIACKLAYGTRMAGCNSPMSMSLGYVNLYRTYL